MKKLSFTTIGTLLLFFIAWWGYTELTNVESRPTDKVPVPTLAINSFDDCLKAKYPIMESYPRQCKTPDGRTFVEELAQPIPTYINASSGVITVITPSPGAVTGKEFEVRGSARGWYFEGSFPVEILDQNGKVLTMTPAQAQSDWMTNDPVTFIAKIKIPNSYIGKATVILKKDNPSGLKENDASMSFPITIEY